jgi:hypothetical protein
LCTHLSLGFNFIKRTTNSEAHHTATPYDNSPSSGLVHTNPNVTSGALFPLLFGVLVHPMCGLNAAPRRVGTFLGVVTLASFASRFGLGRGLG